MTNSALHGLQNDTYHLTVQPAAGGICVRLDDLAAGFTLCDGPYLYRTTYHSDSGAVVCTSLANPQITTSDATLCITGSLGPLAIEHIWRLPAASSYLEEEIVLRNPGVQALALADLACGIQLQVGDVLTPAPPALRDNRLVGIPFRHRATDPRGIDQDFIFKDFPEIMRREYHTYEPLPNGLLPLLTRYSEGWAWLHGEHATGIFKFNQQAIEYSAFAVDMTPAGIILRLGGADIRADSPSRPLTIAANGLLRLGVTRYQALRGDYSEVAYAFRSFLDEQGCGRPVAFNPPVHWEELYDNLEWNLATPGHPLGPRRTRPQAYTREQMMAEAAKGREYSCEALYLDPGWDTDFATLLWGEEWLGQCSQFIAEVREQFGLQVSLPCPLAPWLTLDGRGVSSWPQDSWRVNQAGQVLPGQVCLGSRQYLDEAEKRLLAHCADGVTFLMFDGNWWDGGCTSPEHGHPVPYTMADHCRANLELAQRVHRQHPQVLIEMHDMLTGGSQYRGTPVYWQYGQPGSFDENWGLELMWRPMDDLRSGRALALYYYNMACDVPLYLHVDLRDDNQHCLVLWWYASTCCHLGIGGTHENPAVVAAHKEAMRQYRRLECYYKRGDFYGINEEIHIHTAPAKDAFVVNLFNLSDTPRVIAGSIDLRLLGLDLDRWYLTPRGGNFDSGTGTFSIARYMEPWSAQVVEVSALQGQEAAPQE